MSAHHQNFSTAITETEKCIHILDCYQWSSFNNSSFIEVHIHSEGSRNSSKSSKEGWFISGLLFCGIGEKDMSICKDEDENLESAWILSLERIPLINGWMQIQRSVIVCHNANSIMKAAKSCHDEKQSHLKGHKSMLNDSEKEPKENSTPVCTIPHTV